MKLCLGQLIADTSLQRTLLSGPNFLARNVSIFKVKTILKVQNKKLSALRKCFDEVCFVFQMQDSTF